MASNALNTSGERQLQFSASSIRSLTKSYHEKLIQKLPSPLSAKVFGGLYTKKTRSTLCSTDVSDHWADFDSPYIRREKLLFKIQLADQLKAELLAKLKLEQKKKEKVEERKSRLKQRKEKLDARVRKTSQLSEEEKELQSQLRLKTNEIKHLRNKILDEQKQSISITQQRQTKMCTFIMSKSTKSYLKPTLSIMSVPSDLFQRKPLTDILRRSHSVSNSLKKQVKRGKKLLVTGRKVSITDPLVRVNVSAPNVKSENFEHESDKLDLGLPAATYNSNKAKKKKATSRF